MNETLISIRPGDAGMFRQVDGLLASEGLRRDPCLDYTCGLFDDDWNLIATGSCCGNTLRCLAVRKERQGEGLLVRIVEHLSEVQARRGNLHLFLYTKKNNVRFFGGLGFFTILETDGVAFMENRRNGFRNYIDGLRPLRPAEGSAAAIVMNANPFTLGHRRLVERASEENDAVLLFILSQDSSLFPANVRRRLAAEAVSDLNNVIIADTDAYMISSATFPSYFVRDSEEAMRAHARLDAALFGRIAGELGIVRRYVGEEPASRVTAIYNQTLQDLLPGMGVECRIIPRLKVSGRIVSASTVRKAIADGRMEDAADMLPASTLRYLHSEEAGPVLSAIRSAENVIHH